MTRTAPFRLLIWLAAALVGWAAVIGVCLYLPEALGGFAVAGVLLWRKGQRPVDLTVLDPTTSGACTTVTSVRLPTREDVRPLVAQSV